MRFEIFNTGQLASDGYETYSALLLPAGSSFSISPLHDLWPLLAGYKAFADVFGDNHFSYWLYNKSYFGFVPQPLKLQVHISHDAPATATLSDLYGLLKSGGVSVRFTADELESDRCYDAPRAKHYCDAMNLHYKEAPYIAFFDTRPNIPRFFLEAPGSVLPDASTPTTPLYVLKFGGLGRESSIRLLGALEGALRQALDGRIVSGKVRWQECWSYLANWCRGAGKEFGPGIEVISQDKLTAITQRLRNA